MLSHLGSHPPILVLLVTVLVGLISPIFSRPVGGYGDQYVGEPSHPWTPPEASGFQWQSDPLNGLSRDVSLDSADSSAGSSMTPYDELTLSHHMPPLYQAHQYYANAPNPQDRQNSLINLPTTQDSYLHHGSPIGQFHYSPGFAQQLQPYTDAVGSEMGRTAASAAQPIPPVPIWSVTPPIVATARTNSVPHYNWDTHEAPALLDSSAPAQAPIGQSIAPQEDVFPGPTEVSDRSEMVMRSGRKLGEWENIMRTMLGNPNLEFVPQDELYPTLSRIIFARDASLGIQDLHPEYASPQMIPWSKEPHFTERLIAGQSEMEKALIQNLDIGQTKDRVYIYLNSRANMESLNRHYFMDKMRFLPIQMESLEWGALNNVWRSQNDILILPPARPREMPLMVVRHNGHGTKTRQLLKLTGKLRNQQQIVSLWSPMFKENARRTLVLYGIGQLTKDDAGPVARHLEELKDSWSAEAPDVSMDLENKFPIGRMMHL
ncbi:uncharacterized protein UTRI_10548_B [Ustilago trichophora]|uniref:Effector family protein Eff1 n=1 Tax=Ustilago trichophora TaxID=86804 RepID=A0A5C3EBU3_9BASI|nr:uncharacterized protein UTRI_10548_B [Ustilago trichophora]